MWVVVAKKSTNVHRDDTISDLLDLDRNEGEDFQEFYITKNSSNHRYNVVANLFYAKIYKSKAYCEKIVKKSIFYKTGDYYKNPFHWLKEYHLSYRKITQQEWEKMCDNELHRVEQGYIHQKAQIELKRKAFK